MLRLLKGASNTSPAEPAPETLALRELEAALVALLNLGDAGAIQAIDCAVDQAARHRASDLHFEPWEDGVALRFRIDGLLHEVARLPKEHHARLTARIKILARIPVYQRETPQDGRIEPEATPCGKAMRVSTFPTVHGEKVVVRVLDATAALLDLDALGFQPDVTKALRDLTSRPQGTLLLTGPSSSGKTTTIYAILRELVTERRPRPHVASVEDPVECRLRHIAQTEVRPAAGFTFESALRALLRQDPEVIMVGEIRDSETARTAIQAGLTGHLVISTIHSGSAAGVFARLLDMGIEPFLLASSITGVLAQRLLRVNCPGCAAPYRPEENLLRRYGVSSANATFMRGAGCEACQGLGYHGRTAIGELLAPDEQMADLLLSRPRTSLVQEAALRRHMRTLAHDGAERVRQGLTTVEELARVLPPTSAERLEGSGS